MNSIGANRRGNHEHRHLLLVFLGTGGRLYGLGAFKYIGPAELDRRTNRWTIAMAGDELTPGESLSEFTFDSALTPQDLAGLSTIHPGTPVLTSFTYSGAPCSDPGFSFVVTEAAAAPEPTTLFLFVVGFGGLAFARRYAQGILGISAGGELSLSGAYQISKSPAACWLLFPFGARSPAGSDVQNLCAL